MNTKNKETYRTDYYYEYKFIDIESIIFLECNRKPICSRIGTSFLKVGFDRIYNRLYRDINSNFLHLKGNNERERIGEENKEFRAIKSEFKRISEEIEESDRQIRAFKKEIEIDNAPPQHLQKRKGLKK